MFPPSSPAFPTEQMNASSNPQIVYSWKAPIRAFKKRSKYVLRFYVAVAILLSILIVLLGDKILILPIWAVLFLFYVLTITPPPEIENKISKFGIEAAGITIRWESLSHFYFTDRFGLPILTLVGSPPFFTHTFLVVPTNEIKNQLIRILAEHIVYQDKPSLTLTDRVISLLSYLMPDDEEIIEGKNNHEVNSPQTGPSAPPKAELRTVTDTLATFFQTPQATPPVHPSSATS